MIDDNNKNIDTDDDHDGDVWIAEIFLRIKQSLYIMSVGWLGFMAYQPL